MHFSKRLILLTLAAVFPFGNAASPVSLNDEFLCPAELLVLQADSRRFSAQSASKIEKSGLKKRMLTALATLPALCRRYQELDLATRGANTSFIAKIRDLQLARSESELAVLHKRIEQLLVFAPFDIQLFQSISEDDVAEAGKTLKIYCISCHQHHGADSPNPAYPLQNMAKQQQESEFLARMLLGVKGTSEIGLSNPLTFTEIGAIREYLLRATEQANISP